MSVVIPSFRQPHFLDRAIESCLEQDHDELEVIVIDDRSRDASLGLALSWSLRDPRVRVFEVAHNGGLGKARNIGIAHARGDYLCFLDADDYLLPASISARLDAFPEAEALHGTALAGVYGDWQHVGEAVDYPAVRRPRNTMTTVSAESFTGENVFICSAPLVRRDRVLDAGGFPEGLKMLEDFGLWARMIARGDVFAPVEHVVATYRQRPNSMLRGDGLVVMADHVEVINTWMASQGVELADGGAMAAWLGDSTPFSFGRMSWNVPSVLGTFGGAPGASAIRSASAPLSDDMSTLDDFMTNPTTSGLDDDTDQLQPASIEADTALIVHSLDQAIAAVATVEALEAEGSAVVVGVVDPTDWAVWWPLALAGVVPVATNDIAASTRLDLSEPEHLEAAGIDQVGAGLDVVWPNRPQRSGAIVHVPSTLSGYPALDAWVSTALHALAELGVEAVLMADPDLRSALGGWRSMVFSVDAALAAEVIVSHSGDHVGLLERLGPTVLFDPSSPSTPGAHDSSALTVRLREVVSRRT